MPRYKIFFIIFIFVIYLLLLIKKLIRTLIYKKDLTLHETFTYTDNPPSIDLTEKNFYAKFALEDPLTYELFIDPTIYVPKVYFQKIERKEKNLWNGL